MRHFNPEWLNRPRKKDNPEGRLQLQIIKYLKIMGAVVGKTKTHGVREGRAYRFDIYTFRGFPDLCCFYKQRMYFIEVKPPAGKQSPEQQQFELLCKEANIPYILARDLETIQEIIK